MAICVCSCCCICSWKAASSDRMSLASEAVSAGCCWAEASAGSVSAWCSAADSRRACSMAAASSANCRPGAAACWAACPALTKWAEMACPSSRCSRSSFLSWCSSSVMLARDLEAGLAEVEGLPAVLGRTAPVPCPMLATVSARLKAVLTESGLPSRSVRSSGRAPWSSK